MLRGGDQGISLAHLDGHEEVLAWHVSLAAFLAGARNADVVAGFSADVLQAILEIAASENWGAARAIKS